MEMYTKNFSVEEMSCNCGECDLKMNLPFMLKLQKIRELVHNPCYITSGVRCEAHNSHVGGRKHSYHLLGRAADIKTSDAGFKADLMMAAIKAGCYGIGIYPTFVHIDDRPFSQRSVW